MAFLVLIFYFDKNNRGREIKKIFKNINFLLLTIRKGD